MDLLTLFGEMIAELVALSEEPDLTTQQRLDVLNAIQHLQRAADRI